MGRAPVSGLPPTRRLEPAATQRPVLRPGLPDAGPPAVPAVRRAPVFALLPRVGVIAPTGEARPFVRLLDAQPGEARVVPPAPRAPGVRAAVRTAAVYAATHEANAGQVRRHAVTNLLQLPSAVAS